jgi:hypothetical protein
LAAFDWSSQKPGRCISASSRATSCSSEAVSKVIREQLQLIADLAEPRRDGFAGWHLGHAQRLLTAPLPEQGPHRQP